MWRGKIRELNIWKADSQANRLLALNPRKEIQGIGEVITFYKGKQFMEADITMLSLSVRSFNCLKRAGYETLGDIIEAIDSWQDLLRVRNLGRTSAVEIITGLQAYQKSLFTKADETVIIRHKQASEQADKPAQTQSLELSDLKLSVRSYNCLRRAGYQTVAQLRRDLSIGMNLRDIKNLGVTSEKEILEALGISPEK